MKVSEEAAEQYERSKKKAMIEALEKAREVKQKQNEDRILMMYNQIKDRCTKELFQHLYKAFSQSVMVDI